MDAGGEGPDDNKRDHNHLDEVVQPGNLYVCVLVRKRKPWIVLMVLYFFLCDADVIVLLHQVVNRGDGMQERKLEGPEGKDQHAYHRITGKGAYQGYHHHSHGNPGISPVRDRNLVPVADIYGCLPHNGEHQGRREDKRHYAGREVYGPHQYAQEGQQQGGEIDVPGRLGLRAVYSYKEGHEYGQGQPGELGEKVVGHHPVLVVHLGLHQEHE